MCQIVGRHFEADGLAKIIDIGFIPDEVELRLDEGTNPDIVTWAKRMYDDESIYGHLLTGSSGIVTRLTTAATGISEYDSVNVRCMLPSPDGDGYQASALPSAYTTTLSSAATARSTTALGTVLKPSAGNETGYIYECTTAGTSSAEPTWPTVPGESVTDGTVVFICREERIRNIGVKGVQIGASVSQNTDGNQCYLKATRYDRDPGDIDAGSVVAGAPI